MRYVGRKAMIVFIFIGFVFIGLLSACTDRQKLRDDFEKIYFNIKDEKDNKEYIVEEEIEEKGIGKEAEYIINIEADPKNRLVDGVEKIQAINRTGESIEKLYIRLYLKAFEKNSPEIPYFSSFEDKIFENGKDYATFDVGEIIVNGEECSYDIDGTLLTIDLEEEIENEGFIDITLPFVSKIPKINHRTGANDHAMWLGSFFPVLITQGKDMRQFSSYYPAGDPGYSNLSNYTIKVTTPKDYEVMGSGEEVVVTESGNKKITTLSSKLIREFSLAIGNEYEKVTKDINGRIEVDLYTYSSLTKAQSDLILKTAEETINYYEENIGNYPYTKVNIIETGLFKEGGLEYPLVTFIDTDIIHKEEVKNSIAHEIGHQWFYNVVGNDQINEAWLDEGIAQFYQKRITITDDREYNKYMEDSYLALKENLKTIDNNKMTESVAVYTNWADYYAIQYVRPALMLYSLEDKMGEEIFHTFMKEYFNRHAFKVATKESFIKVAEEVYGEPLDEFFYHWMESFSLPPLTEKMAEELIKEKESIKIAEKNALEEVSVQ